MQAAGGRQRHPAEHHCWVSSAPDDELASDEYFDWRIRYAASLASDMPSDITRGLPGHKAGTPLHHITVGPGLRGRPLAFVSPSPAALSLSAALRSAAEGDRLKRPTSESWPNRNLMQRCPGFVAR